jgi:GNAT superfamily N-acetyltransferase
MKDILLGTEKDKLGNAVSIYRSDKLGMSPAFPFFLKHYAELIEAGLSYSLTTWDDDRCGVIYAIHNDHILGHIVYDKDNPNAAGALWITLSAVEKDSRGLGIYTLLHKYFEQTAKEFGYWAIASHVHVDNVVRLKSAEQVGMKPIFYTMGKRIK